MFTRRKLTRRPRRRDVVVTALALTLLSGIASSVASAQVIRPSALSAHVAPAPCTPSALRETAATNLQNYGPGVAVTMTATIRNSSTSSCNIAIGKISPSFNVTNSQGVLVWGSCGAPTHPTGCPQFLVNQNLAPGGTYSTTATWDQRSDASSTRVPAGTYTLATQFNGIALRATANFQLTSATLTKTVTVTQANSGRNYTLHVGTRLVVKLSGPSIYTWTESVSSNQAVLQRLKGTSGGSSVATFVAKSKGHARITATGNPKCYPQCLMPSRLFSIQVTVVN